MLNIKSVLNPTILSGGVYVYAWRIGHDVSLIGQGKPWKLKMRMLGIPQCSDLFGSRFDIKAPK